MIGKAPWPWDEVAVAVALSRGPVGPARARSMKPSVVPQYATVADLGVASSTCHGAAVRATSCNVLLKEAVPWLEQDTHAQFGELQKGQLWQLAARTVSAWFWPTPNTARSA